MAATAGGYELRGYGAGLLTTSRGGGGGVGTRAQAPPVEGGGEGGAGGETGSHGAGPPGRVKVVIRVRPRIEEDRENARTSEDLAWGVRVSPSMRSVGLVQPLFESREFRADQVLPPDTGQEEMYNAVAGPIVGQVLSGFNGTVMAYGQTGSGKTYTVFGPEETAERSGDPNYFERCGVIPRAIDQIFEYINAAKETTEFRVAVSCLEIYMEYVMDLFDLDKSNMAVREDPASGVFVEGMQRIAVASPFDALVLIQEAFKNRAISQTYMNKTSSRSHVIVFLSVEQRPISPPDPVNAPGVRPVKSGLLTIVDLAGSERVSKSGSDGQRLREAKRINQSLCALGNCVAALSERKADRHIPYRNSKLTRILTDSLGGNTKTCLVATICPTVYNYEESISTCLFATRAMSVRTRARVNVTDTFTGESLVPSPPPSPSPSPPPPVHRVADSVMDAALASRTYSPPSGLVEMRTQSRAALSRVGGGGGGGGGGVDEEYEYYEEEVVIDDPSELLARYRASTQALTRSHRSAGTGTGGGVRAPSSPATDELVAVNQRLLAEVERLEAQLASGVVPKSKLDALWKQREHDLVAKFTRIITHMQSQIEKQAASIADLEARLVAADTSQSGPGGGSGGAGGAGGGGGEDGALEELVAGLLSIPSIRSKLATRM